MPAPALPNTKFTVSKGIYIPELYAQYTIVSIDGTYNLRSDDYILFVDTATFGTSINIDLDANGPYINGKMIIIKDYGGVATTYNINLTGTVDGVGYANTDSGIKDYQARQFIFKDNNWYSLSNN